MSEFKKLSSDIYFGIFQITINKFAFLCYNLEQYNIGTVQKIFMIGLGVMKMPTKRVKRTKLDIIKCASKFFFEIGYSATSPRHICDELDIYTGNITYYFPTKEHLLSIFVEMLCDFQWKLIEVEADKGIGSVASICLETMTVASACEESEIARDFFVAAFQSEMCRNYLRKNHVERAKKIFADRCKDWTNDQFVEAEILVMGLQYSTVASTDASISLNTRIAGALNLILSIYNVDEDTRKAEIEKVLIMDCIGLGKRVLREFVSYIEKTNEQTLEEMLRGNKKT